MTDQEYRRAEGVSRSELWQMHSSPAKFRWKQENPEDPSPVLMFGRMAHKMLLEPETFHDEFVIAPEINRRTKDGKAEWEAFCAENVGKTVVDADSYNTAKDMIAVCRDTLYVDYYLDGEHELPLFWTDDVTGEICKVRLDCLSNGDYGVTIVDYKTTQSADTDSFIRSAVNYGYDFQAAMYMEGVRNALGEDDIEFIFIAQEKDPPYAVNILRADPLVIKRGREMFRDLIERYHECKITDNWYGYLGKHGIVNELTLPAWMRNNYE